VETEQALWDRGRVRVAGSEPAAAGRAGRMFRRQARDAAWAAE